MVALVLRGRDRAAYQPISAAASSPSRSVSLAIATAYHCGVAQGVETLLAEIAAALTTIAAVAAAWWRKRQKKAERTRERSAPRAVAARKAQIDLLEGLALDLGAQRVSLVLAHNGGRDIDPGSVLSVTVLGESHAPSLSPQASEYQGRALIDAQHLDLLVELDRERIVQRRLEDLKPGSMLRDEMERDDLATVILALICRDARGMYFLQAATRSIDIDEPAVRATMRTVAARLATSLSQTVATGGHPTVGWP